MSPKHQLEHYSQYHNLSNISTFVVIGMHNVFRFIGSGYISICLAENYTAHSDEVVVDDPAIISYLRLQAQKHLGSIIQECEEGVFDD